MAYENQIKCTGCGISIPDVNEEVACPEALLCSRCHAASEEKHKMIGTQEGQIAYLKNYFYYELNGSPMMAERVIRAASREYPDQEDGYCIRCGQELEKEDPKGFCLTCMGEFMRGVS